MAHLRPSLERLTEYEQAAQAVATIEASEARSTASLPAGLGAIEEEDSDSDNSHDDSGSDSDAEGELPGLQFRSIPAASDLLTFLNMLPQDRVTCQP